MLGRVTSGVKLIDLKEGDIVASIAKVRKGDEEADSDTEEGFAEASMDTDSIEDGPEESGTDIDMKDK